MSDFDPDAYLAGEDFDPDAYLGKAPPAKGGGNPRELGLGRSALSGFGRGASFDSLDELAGLHKALVSAGAGVGVAALKTAPGRALIRKALPHFGGIPDVALDAALDATAQQTGEEMGLKVGKPLESYAQGRREARGDEAAENKWASTPAMLAGAVMTPGPKGPGKVLGRTLRPWVQRAGQGAAMGALFGAGGAQGEADIIDEEGNIHLEKLPDLAKEAGMMAGVGAVAAPLLGAGIEKGAGKVREWLKAKALEKTRQVLQGSSDIAAATRKPLSDAAAEQALETGAIKPLGTTQGTLGRIETQAQTLGKRYGELVDMFEAQGVKGPDARKLADQLITKWQAADATASAAGSSVPLRFYNEAVNVERLAGVGPHSSSGALGLKQTESLKQDLQRLARFHRLNASPEDEALQEISSLVRGANEEAITSQAAGLPSSSPIAQGAREFAPLKQQLSRTLEARTAVERAASKAAQKGGPSIRDYAMSAATGDPSQAAATLATALAKNRGPSTSGWLAYQAARSRLANALAQGRGNTTPGILALLEALRTSPSSTTYPEAP